MSIPIIHIRKATSLDRDAIREIYLSAFPDSEKELVLKLAIDLLSKKTTPHTISLVAEIDGVIAGHIAFSPVFLESTNAHFGYILAPLAVAPKYQNNKIGSSLVKSGLDAISKMGSFIVFVYGDPQYYSRFGFYTDLAEKFIPPYTLQLPEGWHALKLNSAILPEGGKIICVDSLNDPNLW